MREINLGTISVPEIPEATNVEAMNLMVIIGFFLVMLYLKRSS